MFRVSLNHSPLNLESQYLNVMPLLGRHLLHRIHEEEETVLVISPHEGTTRADSLMLPATPIDPAVSDMLNDLRPEHRGSLGSTDRREPKTLRRLTTRGINLLGHPALWNAPLRLNGN